MPSITATQPDPRFRGEAYRYLTDADELPDYDDLAADPLLKVKLFAPEGRLTYYVAALTMYGEQAVLTGFMVSPLGADCDEFGDTALDELLELRTPRLGLPLERDLNFEPLTLSALREARDTGRTP